jgi:hypothetical protein
MRLVALSVLLIGNLFAHQVLAEDVIPQPLTRAECRNGDVHPSVAERFRRLMRQTQDSFAC